MKHPTWPVLPPLKARGAGGMIALHNCGAVALFLEPRLLHGFDSGWIIAHETAKLIACAAMRPQGAIAAKSSQQGRSATAENAQAPHAASSGYWGQPAQLGHIGRNARTAVWTWPTLPAS